MEDEVLVAWLRRGLETPLPADDPEIQRAIQVAKRAASIMQQESASPLPEVPSEIRDYQIL